MNNNLKIIGIAALVGALVSFGLLVVFKTSSVNTVVERITEKLGAVSNIKDVGTELGINGLQTYVATGSFTNSTTTLTGWISPVPSTSTIDYVALYNSGVATSTYRIQCGAAASASSTPTRLIIDTGDIATSTNFGTLVNNASVGQGSLVEPNFVGATSTVLVLGPAEFFVCKATTQPDVVEHNKAFVGAGEAFDGKFWVRFNYLIR